MTRSTALRSHPMGRLAYTGIRRGAASITVIISALSGGCVGCGDPPPAVEGEVVDLGDGMQAVTPTGDVAGVVVYVHGAGETSDAIVVDNEKTDLIDTLTDAGWVVVAADAEGDAWGSTGSVAAYRDLYAEAEERWPDEPTIVFSQSMGGLAGLLSIGQDDIDPDAWVGIYPVTNPESMVGGRYERPMRAANGGQLPASPLDVDPQEYAGVPMLMWASPADTRVPTDENAALFADHVDEVTDVEVIETVGDHGDPSNFDPDRFLEFIKSQG